MFSWVCSTLTNMMVWQFWSEWEVVTNVWYFFILSFTWTIGNGKCWWDGTVWSSVNFHFCSIERFASQKIWCWLMLDWFCLNWTSFIFFSIASFYRLQWWEARGDGHRCPPRAEWPHTLTGTRTVGSFSWISPRCKLNQ